MTAAATGGAPAAGSRAGFDVSPGTAALSARRDAWDALVLAHPSPFLTSGWLLLQAQAQPSERYLCATLTGANGVLRGGALLRSVRNGLADAAHPEAWDWDVVASDEAARRELWDELAKLAPPSLNVSQLRVGTTETTIAWQALTRAGYGVLPSVGEAACPYVVLPSTFELLLAARSRNARQQLRKHHRMLAGAGAACFRTTTGGPSLEHDVDEFLRVEASGWKGAAGTAIRSSADMAALYRAFVEDLAQHGWLRLHLLELDGEVIAGCLVAALGGEAYFLKTGFNDSFASLRPGELIIAEALRSACAEGLRGMDLGGSPDQYKLRWADEFRPRQRLRVYRGPAGRLAGGVWNAGLRPALRSLRERARKDAKVRGYLERTSRLLQRVRRP